jgi:futalosine hydrolase
MKRILLVFPTLLEANDILLEFKEDQENFYTHSHFPNIDILLTGAGIPNTCFALGKIFDKPYEFVFQFGICGSFHEHLTAGSVVRITEDVFGEMGAVENGRFIRADELNIGIQTAFHEKSTLTLPDSLEKIPKAKGLTVSTLYAYGPLFDARRQRFPGADTESMEGAAFFMSNRHRPNVFQFRAVSNPAGVRDKNQWNIPLALQKLHELTRQIIKEYGT